MWRSWALSGIGGGAGVRSVVLAAGRVIVGCSFGSTCRRALDRLGFVQQYALMVGAMPLDLGHDIGCTVERQAWVCLATPDGGPEAGLGSFSTLARAITVKSRVRSAKLPGQRRLCLHLGLHGRFTVGVTAHRAAGRDRLALNGNRARSVEHETRSFGSSVCHDRCGHAGPKETQMPQVGQMTQVAWLGSCHREGAKTTADRHVNSGPNAVQVGSPGLQQAGICY